MIENKKKALIHQAISAKNFIIYTTASRRS